VCVYTYIYNYNLIDCQHCIYIYIYIYISVRKRDSKKCGEERIATNRKGQKCIGAEFDKVPRRVNDGHTAPMTVKFNLMSAHFIYSACFEADRL